MLIRRPSARDKMIKEVNLAIKKNGFNPDEISKKSIYELEEETSVGHYKVISQDSIRSGYIHRGDYSKKRIDATVKYLLTR